MVSDHTAMAFLPAESPLYFVMRFIGRFTAPIMCFFIAEGFHYTQSKRKYGVRLAVFALISQCVYTYFYNQTLITSELFTAWNVIYTLFIGFCILIAYEKAKEKPIMWVVTVLLFVLSFFGDWMMFASTWILFFHIFRDQKLKKIIAFSAISVVFVSLGLFFGEYWQLGLFAVIPLLVSYNGQKGSESRFHKWAFYLFYPLHLTVIVIIRILVV
jgi:hypothetical protein